MRRWIRLSSSRLLPFQPIRMGRLCARLGLGISPDQEVNHLLASRASVFRPIHDVACGRRALRFGLAAAFRIRVRR